MNQVNCCLTTLGIIILISGAISYMVFSILYLVYFYNDAMECKSSHLWEYVLASLIINTTSIKISTDNYNTFAILVVVVGIINLCVALWGSVELWEICCSELLYSNLWNIGLASFIIQCVVTFICVIIPPILLCYITLHEESLNKQVERIEQN